MLTEKLGLMGVREFNYLNKSELNFVDGTNYQNQFQSVIVSEKHLVLSYFYLYMLSKKKCLYA